MRGAGIVGGERDAVLSGGSATFQVSGGRAELRISHVAYPERAFDTPSGRIEFVSERAAAMGLPALPEAGDADDDAYPLAFAHGRTFAHFHSFYDHARALPTLAAREPEPQLWLAPDDAAARGVADGDAIRVVNARGDFKARAKVTPRIPGGTVWMRDGWPGLNALTRADPVLPEGALRAFPFSVGQSQFGARVEVERL